MPEADDEFQGSRTKGAGETSGEEGRVPLNRCPFLQVVHSLFAGFLLTIKYQPNVPPCFPMDIHLRSGVRSLR